MNIMNKHLGYFIVSSVLFLFPILTYAADVTSIRSGKNRILPEGTVIEGVIVSDYRSPNNALNPNISWDKVDYSISHKTAYLQTLDGSCGIKMVFNSQYLTTFERGTSVTVDLSKCRLVVGKEPECYTVLDVDPAKVSIKEVGVSVPSKIKRISQLTDADLFTQVTLTGLEFLSKQGSYANVYEPSTRNVPINNTVVDVRYGAGDGWAQLLEDAEGNSIYMQVNSQCPWRRNNLGVPGGIGMVSGVLVCEENPRYGRPFGRYSIRPLFKEDIAIPTETQTSFKIVAQWSWDRNYHSALTLLEGGLREWVEAPGFANVHVLAEKGTGLLYTDSQCRLYPGLEYDTRYCSDHNGEAGRLAASLCFEGRTSNWLHPGAANSSIIVETSTKDIEGKGLLFNFSFLAGDASYSSSSGIPATWSVEYSLDGMTYNPTGFSACLRPLICKPSQDKAIGMLFPSYQAAMGFSEYSVPLPASLLGQEKIFVRLVPSSLLITRCKIKPDAELNTEKFNGENDEAIRIFLGMASVKAY